MKDIFSLMHHFWRDSRRVTMRKRWLLMFMFLVAIPAIIVISLFLRSIILESESAATKYSLNINEQLMQSLEYRMNNISIFTDSLLFSIYDNISTIPSTASNEYKEYHAINNFFNNLVNKDMIDSFRLFVPDEKIYARQKDRFFPLSMLESEIKQRMLQGNVRHWWIGNYDRTRFYSKTKQRVFTCVTALRSAADYESYVSVMFVDILESEICNLLNTEETSSVYLVDENDVVLSAVNKELIDISLSDAFAIQPLQDNKIKSRFEMINGKRHLITWVHLKKVPWCIVRIVPFLSNIGLGSFSTTATLIALLIVLAFGFLLMFSFVLDNTILRLNNTVNSLREHGLCVLEKYKPNSQTLSTIEGNVEDITKTIRSLVEEAYEARLASRSAELKALQAQINPHFLYNTLDTLKWMIMAGNSEASIKMISDLSSYFRLSLNKGRDIVLLFDEYNLIRAYLAIQERRFQDEFIIEWDVEEKALDVRIPKLTLQPLIENALLHGIQTCEDGLGRILIRIFIEQRQVIIEIHDNGKGMSKETILAALSRNLNTNGYGINNVYMRLQLFGGDLAIQSQLGKGTSVMVRVPINGKTNF